MDSMHHNTYILDFKQGDVTGNGFPDTIYLTGQKTTPNDIYSDNISIVIQTWSSNAPIGIPLPNASGYDAELFVGHFTSSRKLDILVSIDTGGSGRYVLAYLYTIKDNIPVLLLDSTGFNRDSMYAAVFLNDFKVSVKNHSNSTTFIIDVESNKDMYINDGIYDINGRLLKPTEGGVLGLGALWPVAETYSGMYSLLALQRIIGINNADNLGAVQTYLKWNGKKLIPDRVQVAILPTI